jgi:RNA polymerase sigma factor (sigma-70 family)
MTTACTAELNAAVAWLPASRCLGCRCDMGRLCGACDTSRGVLHLLEICERPIVQGAPRPIARTGRVYKSILQSTKMAPVQSLTDEELLEHYRAESRPSAAEAHINELFGRHHAKVASWCLSITGDVNAATDMAQEVFLKAFQRLGSFRGDSKFTTWLYSIARYHCLDELRSRKTRPQVAADALLDEIEDFNSAGVLAGIEQRESRELLQQLIQESLDETETKAMTLHFVQELPLESVSRILGLTNPSGAKAYIVSAKRKLKHSLERRKSRTQVTRGAGHAG